MISQCWCTHSHQIFSKVGKWRQQTILNVNNKQKQILEHLISIIYHLISKFFVRFVYWLDKIKAKTIKLGQRVVAFELFVCYLWADNIFFCWWVERNKKKNYNLIVKHSQSKHRMWQPNLSNDACEPKVMWTQKKYEMSVRDIPAFFIIIMLFFRITFRFRTLHLNKQKKNHDRLNNWTEFIRWIYVQHIPIWCHSVKYSSYTLAIDLLLWNSRKLSSHV